MSKAPEDITIRLALAALDPESIEPTEMEALLREAIEIIGVLRAAVALRPESRPMFSQRSVWMTSSLREAPDNAPAPEVAP